MFIGKITLNGEPIDDKDCRQMITKLMKDSLVNKLIADCMIDLISRKTDNAIRSIVISDSIMAVGMVKRDAAYHGVMSFHDNKEELYVNFVF